MNDVRRFMDLFGTARCGLVAECVELRRAGWCGRVAYATAAGRHIPHQAALIRSGVLLHHQTHFRIRLTSEVRMLCGASIGLGLLANASLSHSGAICIDALAESRRQSIAEYDGMAAIMRLPISCVIV